MPFWLGFSAYMSRDGILRVMDDQPNTPLDDALPDLIRLATRGADGRATDTGCDLIGAMHTKPTDLPKVLEAVQRHWDGPMLAYPDDIHDPGEFPETTIEVQTTGHAVGGMKAQQFVDCHLQWYNAFPRCRMLGACCGYNPTHIAALSECMAAQSPGGEAL